MKILLASNNSHKLQEFNQIFKSKFEDLIEIIAPNSLLNELLEIDENGADFHSNALLKAKGFFDAVKIPVMADDSGLEVDILNGEPGIYSARYSGENATDASNRQKLIRILSEKGQEKYPAQFRCVICYYDGKYEFYSEGIIRGNIILEERGNNGFGYDPIFIPEMYDKTFAELPEATKNQLSHRAKAIENIIEIFKKEKLFQI